MLQSIRDGAQGWLAWVIVVIICVPFALWGIQEYLHPSPKRVIAEVNGAELSETDFQQRVNQQKQRLYAMLQNQDMDLSFMNKQIRQSTLNQMIEEEVLVQSARNANMRIGDALLSSRIHSIPAFQENGKFSQERYEQAIRNQYPSPVAFEMAVRRELLANQIREGVLRSAVFTDYDQQQHTRLSKQQRSISYLIIPASRFNDSVTITDSDIESYYKEHAAQYMTPEKVSIEYVELSQDDLISPQTVDEKSLKELYEERKASFTTPGQFQARHILVKFDSEEPAEVETASIKARDLLAKINAGESFEELAKLSSDDGGSKNKGGNLGWFGEGAMVKPFEDAVKTMQVGEVSDLVRTQFGWHIIKLEDIKPEKIRTFAEVRDQLNKDIQTERSESAFYEKAERFANLAFEHPESLSVLTETLGLQSKTSELFDRSGGNRQNIISNRKVIEAAFSGTVLKERFNSDVIGIGEQHIVVLRLREHEPAQPKSLADVKPEIVTALKQERTKVEAQTLGKTLLEQIKQNGDSEKLGKVNDLSWSPAHWIGRKDTTLKQPAIVREVFKMGQPPKENKALYQGIELSNGDYAIVALLAVKDGVATSETESADAKAPDKSKLAEQQQQAFGESEFKQLVSGLKAKAEIKDYSIKLSDDDS